MRKHFAFIILLAALQASAQGEWVQKNDFPGVERQSAAYFGLSGKGYVISGTNGSGNLNDFWEFVPTADQWIQRTDFAGAGRGLSVCGGVDGKIFIGTGTVTGQNATSDWWEYGVSTGNWTQKTNFSGVSRNYAASFTIGTKVYVGTGTDGIAYLKDFWEYDTEAGTWSQKADFPGRERVGAFAFAIGSKGYMGLGFSAVGDYRIDIFEYRQTNNSWVRQVEEFPGLGREGAAAFSSEELGKGYIVGGYRKLNTYIRDCWELDQETNVWTKIAGFPFSVPGRSGAIGFAINGVAYVGLGIDSLGNHLKDFWSYQLPTSAREAIAIEARMFPNPVRDRLMVELDEQAALFMLYDTRGTIVIESNMIHGRNEISFAGLPAGNYVYHLRSDNKTSAGKILKSE